MGLTKEQIEFLSNMITQKIADLEEERRRILGEIEREIEAKASSKGLPPSTFDDKKKEAIEKQNYVFGQAIEKLNRMQSNLAT